jgi:hypothetical protein
MKLQPNAGRAWPSIRRRGIAFDLSSPATFASSHNYNQCFSMHRKTWECLRVRGMLFTFQPLVAVVLVYKDIVCTQMLGYPMQ